MLMNEHQKIVNEFFDFVIEKDIPTVAIVKDSMANKYFLITISCS